MADENNMLTSPEDPVTAGRSTMLSAAERVNLARAVKRPKTQEFLRALFKSFFEQKGDRLGTEDESILCGIAMFDAQPVTIVAERKGHSAGENLRYNFGMPGPEGYRKALRVMKLAERFNRPVITFIDTPGAYPGIDAEEHGQSQAIAENLAAMSGLTVPIISVVTGEANSGGALAIGVADRIIMLENSVYSILSPEGFSSILYKDPTKRDESCEKMKLTSYDLLGLGMIDSIVEEPEGGAGENPEAVYEGVRAELRKALSKLTALSKEELLSERDKRFRRFDSGFFSEEEAS